MSWWADIDKAIEETAQSEAASRWSRRTKAWPSAVYLRLRGCMQRSLGRFWPGVEASWRRDGLQKGGVMRRYWRAEEKESVGCEQRARKEKYEMEGGRLAPKER